MRAFFAGAAACAFLCSSALAHAEDPVVVEYVAPPECASSDAFHALLQAQIARTPNPDRPWRFSVTIRHDDGEYVGRLRTEDGVRELRAPKCDDVTAALSLVIAMAQPELPAPKSPEPPPPPPPPIPPTPPLVVAPPPTPSRDSAQPAQKDTTQWRIGVRAEHWSDSSTIDFNGAFVTVGAEIPWGFPKMHFEMSVGALYRQHMPLMTWDGTPPTMTQMLLGIVDAQACPIDLPLGSTGFDVLACGRIAVGLTKGVLTNGDFGFGAWGGGGGRVRWQSPWRFYVQAHFDGLYGTKIEGVPALMDFGGSVGFRI